MESPRIVIVDYGMGNLRSVLKKLHRLGERSLISDKPAEVAAASKLILPGVGHFGKAMENLKDRGLIEALHYKVLAEETPILGICLGMQLLSKWSEEGDAEGLGWIDARTVRFNLGRMDRPRKIPHMGWNSFAKERDTILLADIEPAETFYFVHSYHVVCEDPEDRIMTTEYGYAFTSAVERGNIYGTQFHPEKSHKRGMQMLRNFVANARTSARANADV